MSYTDPKAHDTRSNRFRKIFRLSMLPSYPASVVVWKPKQGEVFVLEEAYYKKWKLAPANLGLDSGISMKLTNGTNDLAATSSIQPIVWNDPSSSAQMFSAYRTDTFDYAHPLTLIRLNDPTAIQPGTVMVTKWDYYIVLVATKLND